MPEQAKKGNDDGEQKQAYEHPDYDIDEHGQRKLAHVWAFASRRCRSCVMIRQDGPFQKACGVCNTEDWAGRCCTIEGSEVDAGREHDCSWNEFSHPQKHKSR